MLGSFQGCYISSQSSKEKIFIIDILKYIPHPPEKTKYFICYLPHQSALIKAQFEALLHLVVTSRCLSLNRMCLPLHYHGDTMAVKGGAALDNCRL